MNLDANVQNLIMLLLKKWKVLILVALIGTLLAYFYTANFTKDTYVSSVEFFATAIDDEITEDTNPSSKGNTNSIYNQKVSNTSKMNYARSMLDTYIELFKTNTFNQEVADDLNASLGTSYNSSFIGSTITYEIISGTSLFKAVVTTGESDLSFQIASQLEETIPRILKTKNNGLVEVSIEDHPVKAGSSESPGYLRKCVIGFAGGFLLAAAIIILKDFLDVRIRTANELTERYDIPVLGSIPEFEIRSAYRSQKNSNRLSNNDEKEDVANG